MTAVAVVPARRPQTGDWILTTHTCGDEDHTAPIVVSTVVRLHDGDYRLTGRRCDGTPIEVLCDQFGREVIREGGFRTRIMVGLLLGLRLDRDVACPQCSYPTTVLTAAATPAGHTTRHLALDCPACAWHEDVTR